MMRFHKLLLNCGVYLLGMSSSFLLLGIATPASAETFTAQSGQVQAELSWDETKPDPVGKDSFQLRIVRDGQTFTFAIAPSDKYEQTMVSEQLPSLKILNLDKDAEPEVLTNFRCGTRSCHFSRIYYYNPTKKQYQFIEHEWGFAYKLKGLDTDGRLEFKSADVRFHYKFSLGACSGFPVQIWQYNQGKIIDVTRRFPKRVRDDAYYWWKKYQNETYPDCIRGFLPAYLADKYLLGEGEDGWKKVEQAYRYSDRQAFFRELRQFLQETGYIR